jgi:hypothetical protein
MRRRASALSASSTMKQGSAWQARLTRVLEADGGIVGTSKLEARTVLVAGCCAAPGRVIDVSP